MAVLVSNAYYMRMRTLVYDKWAEYPLDDKWRNCFHMVHDAECVPGPCGERLWRVDTTVCTYTARELLAWLEAQEQGGMCGPR